MDFPNKKYNIIYADPPWKYKEGWGNGSNEHTYPTMKIEEIKNLNIKNITEDQAHLYLWVTNPFIKEGLEICKRFWAGETFSYLGKHFSFKKLEAWPSAVNGNLPIWNAASNSQNVLCCRWCRRNRQCGDERRFQYLVRNKVNKFQEP